MNEAIALYKDICQFYQSLDRNGTFLDDFVERTSDIENLKIELQIMENLTTEWYDNFYLTESENDWIKKDINRIKIVLDSIKQLV